MQKRDMRVGRVVLHPSSDARGGQVRIIEEPQTVARRGMTQGATWVKVRHEITGEEFDLPGSALVTVERIAEAEREAEAVNAGRRARFAPLAAACEGRLGPGHLWLLLTADYPHRDDRPTVAFDADAAREIGRHLGRGKPLQLWHVELDEQRRRATRHISHAVEGVSGNMWALHGKDEQWAGAVTFDTDEGLGLFIELFGGEDPTRRPTSALDDLLG